MLDLLTTSSPADPLADITLTHALLRAVARGERPDTLRIFRPGPTLAFGRLDALRPGFPAAVSAARERGYEPIVRSAGGHAAVYDGDCLVIEHLARVDDVTAGLGERFDDQARRLRDALVGLGADARIGELPGEYCAGAHSINLCGQIKVAGIAQRAIRNGALTTAVLVVGAGERLRATIAAIYRALALELAIDRAGALTDELPDLTVERVATAVRVAYEPLRPAAAVDPGLRAAARELVARHAVEPGGATPRR